MESSDEEEEKISKPQKYKKSSSDEESDGTNSHPSKENEKTLELLKAETWGPIAEKLLRGDGHFFAPSAHETDLEILLKAAKSEQINPVLRPILVTVLELFETEEAQEATHNLNYAIVLDQSLSFEERENALDDLENSDLPLTKEQVYEAYTVLAKDNSFSIKNRYNSVTKLLYLYNKEVLKHSIRLFKKIFKDSHYDIEPSLEFYYEMKSILSNKYPDLYAYGGRRVAKLLGCNQSFEIWRRFDFLQEILVTEKKLNLTQTTMNDEDNYEGISLQILNSIKHRLKKEEFKKSLRKYLSPLGEDKLTGPYQVIESFYQTPDTEFPPLRDNLGSLLGMIGIDLVKEYEAIKEQAITKSQLEFFDSFQTSPSASKVWSSIIEDAKKYPLVMQDLKEYIKNYPPFIQKKIEDILK